VVVPYVGWGTFDGTGKVPSEEPWRTLSVASLLILFFLPTFSGEREKEESSGSVGASLEQGLHPTQDVFFSPIQVLKVFFAGILEVSRAVFKGTLPTTTLQVAVFTYSVLIGLDSDPLRGFLLPLYQFILTL